MLIFYTFPGRNISHPSAPILLNPHYGNQDLTYMKPTDNIMLSFKHLIFVIFCDIIYFVIKCTFYLSTRTYEKKDGGIII